jgi:(S)-3,5-dihydroxyphenylglycine transaminase
MDFLNDAPSRYPHAISLASGRPDVALLRTTIPWLGLPAASIAEMGGIERYQQYGPTAGLACDIVADWINDRTAANVPSENVLITTGAQEGMLIALLALCEPTADALLVPDPTYLGVLGVALMLGIHIIPIGPANELDSSAILAGAERAAKVGRRARVLYLIADHDNPTGNSLNIAARDSVLTAAADLDLVVIEDVAYRELGFGVPLPSLSTSRSGNVMQLGTFAKLIFPGLRLGYLAMSSSVNSGRIIHACRLTKSFTTLNTATPSQAILMQLLLNERVRFLLALRELRWHYLMKRDAILGALDESRVSDYGVTWNVPSGGFFITVHLPFAFGTDELVACANGYGAILMPMRYFSLTASVDNQVRIAYSAVTVEQLREGIARFARFVSATCRAKKLK